MFVLYVCHSNKQIQQDGLHCALGAKNSSLLLGHIINPKVKKIRNSVNI